MKFICNAEKLHEAIVTADRATGKNLALPILGMVLIIAVDKKIKVRATNLSLGMELTIPAVVEREGVTAVRGDIVAQYLSGVRSNEDIIGELKNDVCILQAKKSKITIKTFPHEDFPTIPSVQGQKVTIPASVITKGVASVVYASAVTDNKPELASVYMYADTDTMVFVATDSFRLAEKRVKVKHMSEIIPMLIPSKNVTEIARVLEGVDDDIVLEYSQNQIAFQHRNVYVTSRLVNGTFPDYKQIIPKDAATEVICLKQDLLANLKMANIFSGKLNHITVTIDPRGKSFVIHAMNSDLGEETSSVDAALTGVPVTLSMNLRYFTDCFQSLAADSVSMTTNGSQKPVVIRSVDDRSFLYLLMPMNH